MDTPIEQHVYTSCPAGEGYDGTAGFQVKARSRGITDSQNAVIRGYCEHYRADRSAQEIETAARREGRDLTQDELAQFPVPAIYYPIEEDLFGLTVMHYLFKDHTGRTGNFIAHTLVFAPEALAPLNYDPLALARSKAFASRDNFHSTELPTLPSLEAFASQADSPVDAASLEEVFADQLPEFTSAIVSVAQNGRPVILCVPAWRQAAPLVEAALLLLPPETRCRTTFATYEHDPARLLRRAKGDEARDSLQVIATPSRAEGGAFQFRPEEYEGRHTIFNFADSKFSSNLATTTYYSHVAKLTRAGHSRQLTAFHGLLGDLRLGQTPGAWDGLVPCVCLAGEVDVQREEELVAGLKALLGAGTSAEVAAIACKYAWKVVESAARKGSNKLLDAAAKSYRDLLDKGGEVKDARMTSETNLTKLAVELIAHGQLSRCARVLSAAGTDNREAVLEKTLVGVMSSGWPGEAESAALARDKGDREEAPGLLADLLAAIGEWEATTEELPAAVLAVLTAASRIGCAQAVWKKAGSKHVTVWLTEMAKQATDTARDLCSELLTVLSTDQAPGAIYDLRLWEFRAWPPEADVEWRKKASELVSVAVRTPSPDNAVKELMKHAAEKWPKQEEQQLFALAAMLEGAGEQDSVAGSICEAHDNLVRKVFRPAPPASVN